MLRKNYLRTMKFSEKKYDEALEELFKQSPSVQNVGFTSGAYKPGLEGMTLLDRATGRPSEKIRSIHVAGTNGKGSVCSMLAAALANTEDDFRVGLYTSPHLLDFRERMKICRKDSFRMISKEDVWEFLDTNKSALKDRSFFEVTTAMAFWWFAKENVDIAVIETGLGGRLDSTNILSPELSIITGIGLDHCALLGDTREKIAGEKAGIFKPGTPALVWGRDDETEAVFESTADKIHAPLFFAEDIITKEECTGWALDLNADCQDINLRTVLAALSIMGMDTNKEAICRTAAITGLRGRWERVHEEPEVICDIGHNPSALEYNFKKLENTGKEMIIVYGVMADKDFHTNIGLIPRTATVIPCAPETPRSLPYNELTDAISRQRPGLEMADSDGTVRGAVRKALEISGDNTIIYIGGSTFVVAEALELF